MERDSTCKSVVEGDPEFPGLRHHFDPVRRDPVIDARTGERLFQRTAASLCEKLIQFRQPRWIVMHRTFGVRCVFEVQGR